MEFRGHLPSRMGIPWNFVSRQIPWNFYSSMEFHGTSGLGMGISSNSMEFGVGTSLMTWERSILFHGTSGEFHGISWNSMEL